ncbi:MAG: sigma-54 factor interaction domain-containing protein, partial [Acidobacteriota bacterium]|nr:sigma-54 factor interaction domain-containing protein [Acidobacteriota bacterium]
MRGRAKNFIKTKKSKNKEKVRKLISFQEQDDFTPEFQLDYGKTCVEFTKFIKGFDFMWEDGWFKRNYGKIKRFSLSDESILLIGETGTGKEVISRLIHFQSKRKEKAFHPLNCSSLNNELLYCELFGHEKGAFTSADRKREGILKSSDGGTVFLDEIQSSSRSFQQVLLRFLDYGEIKPLGSDKIERVDIRIITACCTSPEELLSEGKLLKPFYYRISKLNLYIPPLRE